MPVNIQLRRGSSSVWSTANPVLAEGEVGIELDSFRAKVGNGISSYNDLPYALDFDSNAVTLISVGTDTCNQQLVFSNSNNVTFGLSGQTITASAAGGGGAGSLNLSAGTTSNNLGSVVFSNSNGVSFGLNGSTVTATVVTNYQSPGAYLTTAMLSNAATISNVKLSAGTASTNASAFTFSNSNGVSFGLGTGASAGVVTATVATNYQSPGAYLTTAMASNRGSDFVQATAAFAGTNASGTIASDGISVSVNATVAQSNQTIGLYASSNTTLTSSGTVDARSLSVRAIGSLTAGYSAGELLLSAPLALTTAMQSNAATISNINVSAGTTSNNLSNIVFSNSNNFSFGLNGSTVTGSYTVPSVTNSSWTVSDNATSATVGRLAFTQSNGLTLSLSTSNNGNHTVIGSYTVPTVTNSSLTLSDAATSMTIGRLAFTNSNGLTLSLSTAAGGSATVIGSYTVPTVTHSSWTVSDNATSATVGRLAFTQSNGLTLSLSTSNNGNHTVIGSYTVPTVTNSSWTVSDNATSATVGRLAFTQSNGLTLSLSTSNNGNHTVIGSYTVPTVTNSSMTVSDAATSGTLARLAFTNLNGVTLSLSSGAGGSHTIVGSHNALTVQTVQTLGLYAVSNTEGASSSATFDARTISFQGKGAVSVGYSNGSWVIDAPSAAAGNVTFSAGAASAGLASIVFSNSNGVSFGLNGSTITASAAGGGGVGGGVSNLGNTAGSTGTVTTGNIVFVGSGPISLSQSTGAAGSAATISINGPATSSLAGASGLSVSTNGSTITVYDAAYAGYLEPYPMTNTAFLAAGAGSWYFAPFIAPANMSGGRINLLFSNTSTAGIVRDITGASYVSSSSGGKNQSYSYSNVVALYSQGTGTNSTRLESFWSNSFSFGLSHKLSVSQSGAGSSIQISVSQSISYISEIGSDGAYTLNQFSSGTNSNVAGTSTASNQFDSVGLSIRNMLSDQLIQPIGFNTTITAGAYWLANWWSSTRSTQTSGTSFAGASALDFSQKSQLGISRLLLEASYRNWASTATTARSHIMPYGVYTATSAVPPQFVNFSSDLSSLGSAWVPYFNFQNQGITK